MNENNDLCSELVGVVMEEHKTILTSPSFRYSYLSGKSVNSRGEP